jgi:choline dehydrogenase-like flavoprotein
MQQAMQAYIEHKAGPFVSAPTATGFASLEKVQPDFPDAEQHIQAIVADFAKKNPDADPAGRDALLARQLLDPKEAVSQIVCLPSGVDVTQAYTPAKLFPCEEPGMWCILVAGSTRSLSRGYIHINSADPNIHPTIDPAYYKHPLDVDMMARSTLHLLSFTDIEPLKSVFRRDEHGGLIGAKSAGKLPTTLEEAKEYVQGATVTEYHPIGTCAMLPRERGGAVSDELKVYGTSNVRVADASIFPTPVQGNIVSLVYAVAEKAADILSGKPTEKANGVNGH